MFNSQKSNKNNYQNNFQTTMNLEL